jgi:hypothetical protein
VSQPKRRRRPGDHSGAVRVRGPSGRRGG